jgi:hypothetical protein
MKFSFSLIAMLAVAPASGFTHVSNTPRQGVVMAATIAEAPSAKEESTVKYETEVNIEQKFKVKEIDPKTLDPNVRIQA